MGVTARSDSKPQRSRRIRRGLALALCCGALGVPALADVDLKLETGTPQAGVGAEMQVRLIAKSTTAVDEAISGLDVILTWDATSLRLLGVVPSSTYAWLLPGLHNDAAIDGLNNTFDDGNAYYQALSQFVMPAMVTPAGLPIATFRFLALTPNAAAEIRVVRSLGGQSRSRVFRFGVVNRDVLLGLGSLHAKVLNRAALAASDVSLVAGRRAEAWVYGALDDGMTFGTTVMVELVPRDGTAGTVEFTPAPPVDVAQAGDPWPGFGTFTPFDSNTEAAAASNLNGSVDDNGLFVPVALTFEGALTGCPVRAAEGSTGEWELRLATSAGASYWEAIATSLETGVVRIVGLGDGDGDSFVDLRDWSELQNCFTGMMSVKGVPAFSRNPAKRCGVYDFDNDGDVDGADVVPFNEELVSTQE